ncbi:MAG: 4-(cytidine 5'-diphospho)-2-C-methyl-D-erythritol kinase [Eubacteriales bacterium]|nr:4-(cytidine 5'-diphospho)-2-C-methyl-D-erythritol kinase [Eubacteriales bacterium]
METIKLEAHAKINLSLDVLKRREDGYHEVRMVMQSLALCDDVYMEMLPGQDKIILEPYKEHMAAANQTGMTAHSLSEVPFDERNLMYKAAKLMRETFGLKDGVRLHLDKRIPTAAGLAGGSSDAAAVLRGMNELFGLHADEETLAALGVKIGADVPYCLMGGTALSEGIGEVLTELPAAPPCRVLLAKPGCGVSTKAVYEALHVNERPEEAHPDIDAVISALQDKNIRRLSARMRNILELSTIPLAPEVPKLKEAMLELGAMGTLMSGSGPTVFGLFTDNELLGKAADALRTGVYRELCDEVIETSFYRITAL